MASYISSNANRFYTALESAYGQVAAITAQNRIPAVKLAIQQQLEAATAQRQDGEPDVRGPAGRRQAAHDVRAADVPDELGQDGAAPAYGPLFQAALGGAPQTFAGGDGRVVHGTGRLGVRGAARAEVGTGGRVRRRDPVRGGDRGREHGATECAVHGARRRRERRSGATVTYTAGDGTAEREHLRLLESGDGGAAAAVRRGGGPDGDSGERRLSRIPFQRHGAGRDGQRHVFGRRGGS